MKARGKKTYTQKAKELCEKKEREACRIVERMAGKVSELVSVNWSPGCGQSLYASLVRGIEESKAFKD